EGRRAQVREPRGEHRGDAGDEPRGRRDHRDGRQRRLQQRCDPRTGEPDGRRSSGLARRGIVVQGVHVRRRARVGSHHAGVPAGVATTLGHDPMSMAEHLAAYSAFDNGGFRVSPHSVLKVTAPNGQVLESFSPSAGRTQVISPDLAYVMTDLLRGPVKLYLGGLGGRPVAGKSVTTEAYTGSIFIGYKPQ